MILNIVIDTCVIISALRSSKGASYRILSYISRQKFRYGLSVALYLEYQKKLYEQSKANKIKLNKSEIDIMLKALAFYCTKVPIYYKIRPNLKDENDNMVYECAVNFNADYIVTFNIKDFQKADLRPYRSKIITPQEFLKKAGVNKWQIYN